MLKSPFVLNLQTNRRDEQKLDNIVVLFYKELEFKVSILNSIISTCQI